MYCKNKYYNMQSFGDRILSDCMKIETKNSIIVRSNESDISKYFKDSMLFATHSENKDFSRKKSKKEHTALDDIQEALKEDESYFEDYFKDSLISSKIGGNKENISCEANKLTDNNLTCSKRNFTSNKTMENSVLSNKSRRKRSTSIVKVSSRLCSISNRSKINYSKQDVTKTSFRNIKLSISDTRSNEERSCMIGISSSLSLVPTQDRCKLVSWGLPPNILQKYEARGITTMFHWQVECLSNYKVMEERRNLVYSAPTSAGKTLVAEILLIKTVLEQQKKAIFILPFVSVVREKMYYFQDLLSDSGIRVEGFMGGLAPSGGFAATHVAIATIEKANSLINRLMEEHDLTSLGIVVIDELHLLGDPNRGYLLELLLTKLKYMTLKEAQVNIQLIGMSATLPNLPLLAKWLDAELYKTDFRPVPLNEHCKIGTIIYDNKLSFVRDLIPSSELPMDSDNILQLCIETISDGHSVLIFCPTKNWCEKLAEQIATAFFKLGRKNTSLGEILKQQLNSTLIFETLEQLKRSPVGLDNVLRNTVSFSVAFHHAGLTMDERDIIEGSFRSGSLRVLTATSTLSSGVNLPARRVIIRSPMFGGKLLDTLTYKQMIGRAGRMGRDTAGESILICKSNERNTAETLLSASLEPIESCLEGSGLLTRALLEAVASEVVLTPEDFELYIKCTLSSFSEEEDIENPFQDAVKFLVDNEFLLLQTMEDERRWVATPLGKACLAASVPPREGLFLFEELQKARRCFVLDTELHVIYLVTPINSGSQIPTIDWMTFLELWRTISESERRVGQLVGVEERFLMSAIKGIVKSGKPLSIHKRFYTALALHDLVREVPLNKVCKKYGCCRGVLQSLQQSAATFAGMVTQFCKQLGWDCMELLVAQFQTRLQFGVCRELLDLLRLPMLNGLRARSLYKQGITTVADLAVANELDVERALYKALPFESEKEQDGEHESDAAKRNKARTVFVTGRDGLTPHEAAVILVKEARLLVQNELGLKDMSWKHENDQSSVSNSSIETTENILQVNPDKNLPRGENLQNVTYTNSVHQTRSNAHQIEDTHNVMINKDIGLKSKTENSLCITSPKQFEAALDNKISENAEAMLKEEILAKVDEHDEKPASRNIEIVISPIKNSPEKISRFFSDFTEIDSPEMIIEDLKRKRDSESLISFKSTRKKNSSDDTSREIKELEQNTKNLNSEEIQQNIGNSNIIDMPDQIIKDATLDMSKKLKCLSKNFESNTADRSTKSATSNSPSLFEDSLNLDTQICDMLEQNIIDTLHISEFGDFDISQHKASLISNPRKRYNADNKIIQTKLCKEDGIKNKRLSEDFPVTNTPSKYKNDLLTWDDDSWYETKKSLKNVDNLNNQKWEDAVNKHSIKNITNTNVLENIKLLNSMSKTKSDDASSKTYVIENKNIVMQKCNSPKISTDKSVTQTQKICNVNCRVSADLNISDCDDVIIPSQTANSSVNSTKNWAKLKLNTIRKVQTQKNSEQTPKRNDIQKEKQLRTVIHTTEDKPSKIKPKLKEILARNILLSRDCSTDSMVSNSDEDSPIKKVKILGKPKIGLSITKISSCDTEIQLNTKTRMQKTKNKLNEINWNKINVIYVGRDRKTFNLFKSDVMKKLNISIALSCETFVDNTSNIGSKVVSEGKKKFKKRENYVHGNKKVCGVAICWEGNIAYYISLDNREELKISVNEQMGLLQELLTNKSLYIRCFATKEVYKVLYECCGISASCRFLDPKVANWLYNNSISESNFNEMVSEFFPQGCFVAKRIGINYYTGPGLNIKSTVVGEFRSAAEAVLTWHMMETLLHKLQSISPILLHTFKEVEMRTVTILACMELTGLGVSLKSLQKLSSVILQEMSSLEQRAYCLAGRKFNFSSSKDVGQVLGLYKGKKISTNKAVLEQCNNPISTLVISWRKLNATQTKIIFPLLNLAQHNCRIRGNCVTSTLTGRISMYEPNLQNVPKDFNSEDNSLVISVRMAFVPSTGNIMLSADYCQLELRILAHFSKDPVLCEIMQKEGDIFKSIAAKWNQVSEEKVDDKMRQHTKQLCYGMIYGMGTKTLAENLSVTEIEAKEFFESFMNTYPKIRQWINDVLEEARRDGYVTTLLERRRMLPGLSCTKSSEKSQTERQAINTKVQGSAADIAKKAMISIEDRMRCEFPNSAVILAEKNDRRKLRSNSKEPQQEGGYLVLQLHDEFLFEVNLTDLQQVAILVKESMEQVYPLTVPLPVKVKVGPAWGDLVEYHFQGNNK